MNPKLVISIASATITVVGTILFLIFLIVLASKEDFSQEDLDDVEFKNSKIDDQLVEEGKRREKEEYPELYGDEDED